MDAFHGRRFPVHLVMQYRVPLAHSGMLVLLAALVDSVSKLCGIQGGVVGVDKCSSVCGFSLSLLTTNAVAC